MFKGLAEIIIFKYNMVFNRTRKQRNKRGGSPRSEVISNYWGTCRFEKGRKKTRCLLDQQRGFWDAHGFNGNVYAIYENEDAKQKFLQNVKESNKKRITDYLDKNRNENDRFIYRHDPWNDTSDDENSMEFKKIFGAQNDYAQLTADDDHLKKKANYANYEKHRNRIMSDKPKEKTRQGTSRLSPVKEETYIYPSHYYSLSKTGKAKARRKLRA